MKRLDDSPYAILEVPRSASAEQIEAAYVRLRDLLADGQMAAYGMLDANETARHREQLELAYELLRDGARRAAYDEQQNASKSAPQGPPLSGAPPPRAKTSSPPLRLGRRRLAPALLEELGEDTAFDGPLLRRLRESAGASLDEFCEWTKISRRYLKAIEANDYGLLPAAVYVRGFVSEYARLLGMPAKAVADSYLAHQQRWRARR